MKKSKKTEELKTSTWGIKVNKSKATKMIPLRTSTSSFNFYTSRNVIGYKKTTHNNQ